MESLTILVGFDVLGNLLSDAGVPLPGDVLGMLLLLVALVTGRISLPRVEPSAQYLLQSLPLWFVPLIIGALSLGPLLQRHMVLLMVSVVARSWTSLVAAGGITAWLEGMEAHHP